MTPTALRNVFIESFRAGALFAALGTLGGQAPGSELRVLLYSLDGSPIAYGEIEAHELYETSKSYWGSEDPELPPGDYRLQASSLGFAPYQGEITVGPGPQVVRIGLTSAHATARTALRGNVIRSEGDTRNLWVDLQPVYELAWPLRTLNNTAVKSDGNFTLANIQPGLYTLLLFGDRTVPENSEFYEAPYELLHAQVVRVKGETRVEVRLGPATEATLRIP